MSEGAWKRQWEVFDQLVEVEEPERAALLEDLCGDDLRLRSEVESLLRAHERTGSALDHAVTDYDLAPSAFQPPATLGPFTVGERIGSGGMGEVFAGERMAGGFTQRVAIKFATSARFAPELLRRFQAERQILSDLNHPNVAQLFDGGATSDGVPYLVMEFIDGRPVDRYCDEEALGLDERLALFCDVCQGVHFAHQNLVIHRDLKPGNILVDGSGRPKLLDFGIAKLLDPDREQGLTAELGTLVTPEYGSPEQLRGQALTTASDVYSLGVILFQLLTGSRPYSLTATNMEEVVRQVCELPAPPPSHSVAGDSVLARRTRNLGRRLKGDLDRIVLKALRKEPERRYPSAEQLADDIQRHRDGLPIQARADTAAYVFSKLLRRHPWGAAATALGLAALVAFAWTNMQQAAALRGALDEARREQAKSHQVTRFLQDLFSVSDPLVSEGGEVTARALLDEGRQRLDVELADQPGIRGPLLVTLGTVYNNLSEFETAEKLLREAVDLVESNPAGRDGVSARIALGQTLLALGRYEDAGENLERALDGARALDPPDPELLSEAELRLGRNLQAQSHLDEAEALMRTALERRQSAFGVQDVRVAEAHLVLGGVLWRQGRYEAVREPYETALGIHAMVLGPTHHKTLQSRSALGLLMLRLGSLDAAAGHFEEILARRLEALGPGHVLTADTRNNLGAVYFELGRLDEAREQLEQAAAVREARLGPSAGGLAQTLNNLALVKQQQRDLDGAAELYRRVLDIHRESGGEHHWNYASTLNNLGLVDYDRGDFATARDRFARAHELLLEILGEGHPRLVYTMTNRGRALLALGDGSARSWFEQALALHREKLDPGNPALADTLTALGESELRDGNLDAARQALAEALDIRRSGLPEADWRTGETEHLYGIVLNALGDDEGAPLARAGAARLAAALGADHWRSIAAARRIEDLAGPPSGG